MSDRMYDYSQRSNMNRYQDVYPEMRPSSAADEQHEYSDYDYEQDIADDAYSDDEPSESTQQTAYSGQVSPGTQASQDYRSPQSVQEAQARFAQSQFQQQRTTAQPVSTMQAYRQSQPGLPQQQQHQARQAEQYIQQQSYPGLPAQQQPRQGASSQQQSHPGLSPQHYQQVQQLQYAQKLQQARQLQQADQVRQEAQQLQRAQQMQQAQLDKQHQQAQQKQQIQQAQQPKDGQQLQQSQQLPQQQTQQAQQTKRLQVQQLLQIQQAVVQQNPQRAQQMQQQQAQYQQKQQAYPPNNVQESKHVSYPNHLPSTKSKDNVAENLIRPQTQEGKNPCLVKQYTARVANPQQYAQLGDGMQATQQHVVVRKQPVDRQYYYNTDTRPQFPARYLTDGTYAAMNPIKTSSDVAKARQAGAAYPASAVAQSGDTTQKAKIGKIIAYTTAADRMQSPQARAASVTGAGPTYQQQSSTVRPTLQQYEPRRSQPIAVPRQQEQQRYASPDRQGKVSDQWAEEIAQQRFYNKANESRHKSPNMNQYLYTSTN